jgi:drug/metabolite transporter (DMT)-like permease
VTVRDRSDGKHTAIGVGDLGAKLLLVMLCLIWGISWPLMKIALDDIPPLSMRAMSAAFGAVTLLAICLVTRRPLRIPNAKAFGHVIALSLLNIVGFSLFSAFAQMAAATSRVTILVYTMPIWSVLLAWIVLRERPSSSQVLAVVLCALGLAVLIYPLATAGVPLGLLLAVASGLSWGAGTIYVKWVRLQLDSLAIAAWQVTIAFLVVTACMFVFDGRLNLDNANAGSLLCTAFAGIDGSGIAYAMWFEVVRRLPAATASLGILGTPVVGVLSTVVILGERPTITDLVGFALIFAASACVVLAPAPASQAKKDAG